MKRAATILGLTMAGGSVLLAAYPLSIVSGITPAHPNQGHEIAVWQLTILSCLILSGIAITWGSRRYL